MEPVVSEPEKPNVETETKTEPAAAPKKKGKKKKSYKAMMAGMMNTAPTSRTADKEKEAIHKVTGGGAFQKIEKI